MTLIDTEVPSGVISAETLRELMSQACEVRDSSEEAAKLARQWLRDNPELFDRLLEPIIWTALLRAANDARHNSNRRIRGHARRNPALSGVEVDDSAVTGHAYRAALTTAPAVLKSVLEIQTPLGRTIGDCIGVDLIPVADAYRDEGRGKFAMATLCEKLGRMAGEQRVRDVIDPHQANRIYRQLIAE